MLSYFALVISVVFPLASAQCPSVVCANSNCTSGFFTSPNFPGSYPNGANCPYNITVPSGYILLTVQSFNTEQCCDYLMLYDGPNTQSPQLIPGGRGWRGSAQYVPPGTTAGTDQVGGRDLYAVFISDGSVTAQGFNVSFNNVASPVTTPPPTTTTTTTRPPCHFPDYNAAVPGSITSPGFPGQYGNRESCYYVIVAVPNMYVLVTVVSFQTERCCDRLTLYDGPYQYAPGSNMTTPIATLSGSYPAGVQFSTHTSPVLSMYFRSDISVLAAGFNLTYSQIRTPLRAPRCPGANYNATLNGNGTIQSPGYPSFYGNNEHCNYFIRAPQGMRVQLRWASFITEQFRDFAFVYDGQSQSAVVLGEASGTATGRSYTTSGNVMRVEFITDNQNTNQGFQGTFTAVQGS